MHNGNRHTSDCALCIVHCEIGLGLHRRQEFSVRLRLGKAFKDDFHLLDRRERVEHASHDPDAVEVFLVDEQFFFSRAGTLQVDRREQTLVESLRSR